MMKTLEQPEQLDFFSLAESLSSREPQKVAETKVKTEEPKAESLLDIEEAKKKLLPEVINELKVRADHLVVETPKDADNALYMRDQAYSFSKQIEKTRLEIIKPALDFQRAVKQFSDGLRGQFDHVSKTIEAKMEGYLKRENLPVKLENEAATAKEVEVWRYETRDRKKIPLEYMMPDEKAIKEAIADGVREIPGIRIYSDKLTQYRSKPKK